jgi:hypothetical protein
MPDPEKATPAPFLAVSMDWHAPVPDERFRRVYHKTMDHLIEEKLVPDDRSTMELLEEVQPHVVTAVSVALPIMGQSAPEEVVAAVYDTLQQIIDRLL